MTPKQTKLARHALGLPNRRRRSYRNYYVAAHCPGVYDEWAAMVDRGLAERSGIPIMRGPGTAYRFWLTPEGASAALDPGETLCPEDFPPVSE